MLRAKLIYSSLGPVHPVTLLKFGHVATQNKTQTDVNQGKQIEMF